MDAQVIRQEAFEDTELQVIEHEGEEWFTAKDIGEALGFERPRIYITRLFHRNKEELRELSTVVKLTTLDGKTRRVRVFNLQAVQKFGFFAQTPRAKAFRHWASHMLAHGIHRMKEHILSLESQHRQALAQIADLKRHQTLALPAPTPPPLSPALFSEEDMLRLEAVIFNLEGELGEMKAKLNNIQSWLMTPRKPSTPYRKTDTAESGGRRAFNAFLKDRPVFTRDELFMLTQDFAEGVHIACGDYAVKTLHLS